MLVVGGTVPEETIVEEVCRIDTQEPGGHPHQEASHQTAHDGKTNCDGQRCGLIAGLVLSLWVLIGVTSGRRNDRGDRCNNRRQTVKIVHTTDILDAKIAVELRGDEHVAEHRNSASDKAHAHGSDHLEFQMSRDTHRNATGQSRVLDVNRIEATAAHHTRDHKSGQCRAGQTQEGVHDRSRLRDTRLSNRSVETGPQDPQEECTGQREHITAVVAGVIGMTMSMFVCQEDGCHHTKIGTQHVNIVTTTNIDGLQLEGTYVDVQPEEDRLNNDQDQKLEGRDLAEQGTKADHDRTGAEETVQQLLDTNCVLLAKAGSVTTVHGLEEGLKDQGPLDSQS
mmetsp:Transcript_13377/g.34097  ORF Transcript_13377/g.34097 Transcript_13377/m.34097 type:complete len:338 (+) Transcript_13377:133-1146(+)